MRILQFMIFLAIIASTSAVVRADSPSWRVMRTERFIIYYAAGMKDTASRAGSIAEKWHSIIALKLNFNPKAITPLYLYPNRPSFADATGVGVSENIVGMAHVITLRVQVDASGGFTDIVNVIPHELVHVFMSRKLRWNTSKLPLWMHEGLAKYLANDWNGADAELLADAASSGEIRPLRLLAKVFPTDERKRDIAYVESYSAVRYMAESYGPKSIPDLLDEMSKGRSVDEAMMYATGVSSEEFEGEWEQRLWDDYKPGRWEKILSSLIWPAMSLLAILAFLARRRQKRRKVREFEEESEA